MTAKNETSRTSLYAEVTARVIAELEKGRLPWVQPWDAAGCGCAMPANAMTGRRYSGINVLILWSAGIGSGYSSQCWLTYRQAQAVGGNVRKGEKGTTICYADRFRPRDEQERARDEHREARQLARRASGGRAGDFSRRERCQQGRRLSAGLFAGGVRTVTGADPDLPCHRVRACHRLSTAHA